MTAWEAVALPLGDARTCVEILSQVAARASWRFGPSSPEAKKVVHPYLRRQRRGEIRGRLVADGRNFHGRFLQAWPPRLEAEATNLGGLMDDKYVQQRQAGIRGGDPPRGPRRRRGPKARLFGGDQPMGGNPLAEGHAGRRQLDALRLVPMGLGPTNDG